MGKKTTSRSVSINPSAVAPAPSSNSHGSDRSSILRSCFSPSTFQLHLFASVIQSFESQQLRVHDVHNGRLRQQHQPQPGLSITSLDWGYYGISHGENGQNGHKRKRKRAEAGAGNVVIGYGTSTSEICMYSPTEGRVIGRLSGPHDKGIRDFRFVRTNHSEAWSIGGDGKLVQWDLLNNLATRSIPLQDPATGILALPARYEPHILCASTTPFSIYLSEDFRTESFNSFKGPVRSLIRSGKSATNQSELFLAAENDRYINVFDIVLRKLVRTLVVGSEVEHLDCFVPESPENTADAPVLAVVTKDGLVELFSHPFKLPTILNGDLKSSRKSMTRKATAQVRLVTDGKNSSKIFTAALQGPDLIIVSVEGGIEPVFQKLRWQDEGTGELLFEGLKDIPKTKTPSALNAVKINGAKDMGKSHVNESRTVVLNATGDTGLQDTAIEISSGEDEEEDEMESDEDPIAEAAGVSGDDTSSDADAEIEQSTELVSAARKGAQVDTGMRDIEKEEPSFGDLLASKHPNMIAITDSFEVEKPAFDANKQISLPSGMSLGTVLTQALRTNDTNLLESCLHANDVGIVQNTIQRLDSALATNLLSKLAERLASRPGRYGHLLSWVQWTCIAHGGVIAAQPDITSKIRTLYKVLTQRSKSLDKLLLLKGKLDMLDAQLTLRKQIQARRGLQTRGSGEPGMVFIEGEADNWSSDDDAYKGMGAATSHKNKKSSRHALTDFADTESTSEDEEEEDDDDAMLATNGIASEGEDDLGSSSDAEVNRRAKAGLYDVEADVSGQDDSEEEGLEGDDPTESDENDGMDEEEDNSSMDSFINDGEISYASEEDQLGLDDELEIRKPEKKRRKQM